MVESTKLVQDSGTWEFFRDAGGWRWRRVDSRGAVLNAAQRSYRQLKECAANAKAYGFSSDIKPAIGKGRR
jgi:hypothetical protein